MEISVEISYYPLAPGYGKIVSAFLHRLEARKEIRIIPGGMSSVLVGDYDAVFRVLQEEIRDFMEEHPSVFTLKLANSCPV